MEFNQKEWLGNWESFENYIESTDEKIIENWKEAESLSKVMPMFSKGVKAFWQSACYTTSNENNKQVDKWNITSNDNGLNIEWIFKDGTSLVTSYKLDSIVEKGLENKENFLFVDDSRSDAFKYMLAMAPMPSKGTTDLLSHFHFQYASNVSKLIKDDKLVNSMWYATMVDSEGTLLQKCNLLRALHPLPKLEK